MFLGFPVVRKGEKITFLYILFKLNTKRTKFLESTNVFVLSDPDATEAATLEKEEGCSCAH